MPGWRSKSSSAVTLQRGSTRGRSVGCPDAGGVEEERGVVEGERRLGAFVVVQRIVAEPVAAAARREVVERLLQAVAAQEPLERANRSSSMLGLVSDSEGNQLRFDERRGVERLLIAGARRGLATPAGRGDPVSRSVLLSSPHSSPSQRSDSSPTSASSGRSSA